MNTTSHVPVMEGITLRDMVEIELAAWAARGVPEASSLAVELGELVDHDPTVDNDVLDWAAEVRALGYSWATAIQVASVFYYG